VVQFGEAIAHGLDYTIQFVFRKYILSLTGPSHAAPRPIKGLNDSALRR
jgi:hypothetical protein